MSNNTVIRSRTVVMPIDNIDTDQIIPARFLTTTSRSGLGKHLFAAWRFDAQGKKKDSFVLNQPQADGCAILVGGVNSGCGSSREHAPWALLDYGIKAVVSCEIADIFRSNALKNGLLPIVVDERSHQWLLANPGAEIQIDIEQCKLTLPDNTECDFFLEAFARHCLIHGVDELGFLMSHADAVAKFERERRL